MHINGLFFAGVLIGGLIGSYLFKRYFKAIKECALWRQSALDLQRDINTLKNK